MASQLQPGVKSVDLDAKPAVKPGAKRDHDGLKQEKRRISQWNDRGEQVQACIIAAEAYLKVPSAR